MNLTKTFLTLAVGSLVAVPTAFAQQDQSQFPIRTQEQEPTLPSMDKEPDFKGYVFTKVPGEAKRTGYGEFLLAGTEMVNKITGDKAFVSGVITVVTESVDASELASQYGLTVERLYPRLNMAMLKAEEGTDMLSLERELKAVGGITGIKVEIVSELNKPHRIK